MPCLCVNLGWVTSNAALRLGFFNVTHHHMGFLRKKIYSCDFWCMDFWVVTLAVLYFMSLYFYLYNTIIILHLLFIYHLSFPCHSTRVVLS